MDVIMESLPSKDPATGIVYDSIIVMVDNLTKYSHFLPRKESMTAMELAHLVVDRLIRHHGIPESFITDRDKLFTSDYGTLSWDRLKSDTSYLQPYHPETDGQTERTNHSLEGYLWHYVNSSTE